MAVSAEALPLDPRGRPTNLPPQLTTFVGRERELAEISRLLDGTRLLTLVGAGGVGKTRLGLRVADDLLEQYSDGAWLVELASLADPLLVPYTVAAALGVRQGTGEPVARALARALQAKHLLLVLDNCEHLVSACAELADHLLRACPHVQVLTTSRQPLGLGGETIWRVPSLTVPDPRVTMGTDEVAGSESVRLFLDRAQAALPGFVLEDRNAAVIARICRRLDGIPLALELAAAWLKVLSPQQILERLDDRFRLLVGGSRTAPSRQQTLRAALDWSFLYLDEPERVLFGRLAVFAGGWTLDAAEAVCAGDDLEPEQVLEVLGQLVDKSMVLAETQPGPAGYRLLETLRQYAQERLATSGQAQAVQRRHAAFFLALAEQAEPAVLGPEQTVWFERLEREHDNLRAALRSSIDAGDAETSLRLAGALGNFWLVRGHRHEGQRWLQEALAEGATGTAAVRAKALVYASLIADSRGDYEWAASGYEEAFGLLRQLGDRRALASMLRDLGLVERRRGRHQQASTLLEESLAVQRDLGERHGAALALSGLGQVASDQGADRAAEALYQESLALFRELGDHHRVGHVLDYLGLVAGRRGDRDRAAELCERSLAVSREVGCKEGVADALIHLATLAEQVGSHERAVALCVESLGLYRDLDEAWGLVEALESTASVLASCGPPRSGCAPLRGGRGTAGTRAPAPSPKPPRGIRTGRCGRPAPGRSRCVRRCLGGGTRAGDGTAARRSAAGSTVCADRWRPVTHAAAAARGTLEPPRAAGGRVHRPGAEQSRDRRGADHRRAHSRGAHHPHPHEAGPALAGADRRVGDAAERRVSSAAAGALSDAPTSSGVGARPSVRPMSLETGAETQGFYEALASDYHLIFADWQASIRRQAEVLDWIIRRQLVGWPPSMLDCTCGIGTQAIGLALRGYRVHATDLSRAAVERAQREAAAAGATLSFGIADLRSLADQVQGQFEVVLSCDNALPHLLSDADLERAARNLWAKLLPGGLLLVSIRDYDALLERKPSAELPRLLDGPDGRRIVFQVWDWEPEDPTYRLHHFIVRQEGGDWRTTHGQTRYRALRRAELRDLLAGVGFRDIRWQLPDQSGYYQPLVTARKPNGPTVRRTDQARSSAEQGGGPRPGIQELRCRHRRRRGG